MRYTRTSDTQNTCSVTCNLYNLQWAGYVIRMCMTLESVNATERVPKGPDSVED